jgi:ribosome maturation factor RimP
MVLKSERKGLEKKFYDIAIEVVKEAGYELYDLDYNNGSKTLRVFIMDPATNTALIEDCVKVDRGFTPFMEEADWIPDDIILEVSSPGLYRGLTCIEHFNMAGDTPINLNLKKTLGELLEGESLDKKTAKAKTFVCHIEEVADDHIVVALDEEFSLKINYTDIKKANLEPEIQRSN